ncbi:MULTISPECIES: hypothetical protein [Enterobacter]|uniref:hypothetical protein n=1 Tax=Enterobacter TaxID=547 RepID=UPI0022363E8B|nr:hypothetical protein [Enterobacter mori]MCW4985672.1 hypothetical protein [Enterobacter mori]
MNDVTRSCTGCGKPHPQSELFSMPSGRGAYRRENYYCRMCKEAVWKKQLLKTAKTNFCNSRVSFPTRTRYPFKY